MSIADAAAAAAIWPFVWMTTCGIRLLSTAGRAPAPYLPLSHTLATTFENGQSTQSAADSAVAASSRLADIYD